MNRAFKGVWIPKEIWLSDKLTLQEKVFLVEIDSLDNEKGCFASNKHFANFFNLSKNRCSEVIKSLEAKGLISIRYIKGEGGTNIDKRVIRVFGKSSRGIREIDRPIREVEGGYSGKLEESNTSNSNTSNNTIPYVEIINYLNDVSGKKYRSTTQKTKDLIKARWIETFTVDDFKKVIDKKVKEWTGTDMAKYIRPETLFGNKFEGYLNQEQESSGSSIDWDDL